jgi:hypothetical protein
VLLTHIRSRHPRMRQKSRICWGLDGPIGLSVSRLVAPTANPSVSKIHLFWAAPAGARHTKPGP